MGVTIDSHYKWDKHIDNLCKRLRSGLYGIRILEPYVNKNVLLFVYFALVESLVRYGILAWGSTTSSYIAEISNIQKRIFKIIFPTQGDFQKCNLLAAEQLHKFIFIMNNYFSPEHKINPKHEHATRNIHKFVVPQNIYNNYGKQTKRFLVPKIFNELPNNLLTLTKFSEIKKFIRGFLLDKE